MRGQILSVWQNWAFFKEGFHAHSIVFCEYSTFYVQMKNSYCLVKKMIEGINTLN